MQSLAHLRVAANAAFAICKTFLTFIGVVAVIAISLHWMHRHALPTSFAFSESFAAKSFIQEASADEIGQPLQSEQRVVAEAIAKRYRVAEEAAAEFVALSYRAGAQHSVEPLLILAVMAVESRYNPVAESSMGAKGLMQVMPKFHLEKFVDHGGEDALLDPEANIYVGTRILREYLRRFGDTETALQMYAGAFDEPTSQYANKVFAEKARLEAFRLKARKQSGQSV
jgi:soluble lytic murein transglycosylase-like protein